MAVVSFGKADGWVVARWAFRRLFSDIQDKYSVSLDIQNTFEQAMALDGLHFDLFNNNKKEILYMMRSTIDDLICDENELHRKGLDKKGYKMYREALPELLAYIDKYSPDAQTT